MKTLARYMTVLLAIVLVDGEARAQLKHGDEIVIVEGADRVRARTRPTASGDGYTMGTFLTWVPRGTEMKYTEKSGFANIGEWYHVMLPDGRDAWISGRYLRQEIARDALVVLATNLNVRLQPSGRSEVVGKVEKGDILRLVHTSDDWYLTVLPNGRRGYVHKDFVDHKPLGGSVAEPAPAAEETAQEEPAPPEPEPEPEPEVQKEAATTDDEPVDHRQAAEDLAAEGRIDEAIGAYEKALEAAPRDGNLLFEMAKLLQQQDRRDDALAAFRKALRGRPSRPEAKFYVDQLLQMGEADAAPVDVAEEPPLPEGAWTDVLSDYGPYVLPAVAAGSLAFIVTMVIVWRRRRGRVPDASPLYRRRKPDGGFDAVLKYAVEKRPMLREIEEAEKKLAEMDSALRERFQAFGPNGPGEGPKLPPGETADVLLKKVEDLRKTIVNQEERARIYSDLVVLQNEKIQALDDEIDALKKLIQLDFREGKGAASKAGTPKASEPPRDPSA